MYEQQLERTANTDLAPALNLIFDGLFFFCFNTDGNPAVDDPAGECRVGFITTAPGHHLIISGKQTTLVGSVEITTGFETTISHAEARSMSIELDVPGVPPRSITRKGHNQAIDRAHPTDLTKEYFKWIIDLENAEMHNTKLPLIRNVMKPVMHINIGEFYTAELSRAEYYRTKVGTAETPFGRVAARTGLRIAALPQGQAFLRIGASTLPLVAPPGATYEVTFTNRCPKCDVDTPEIRELHLSDFPHYYHAFDVKILDQFDFDFEDVHIAFPPAVCYASGGSRTTDL